VGADELAGSYLQPGKPVSYGQRVRNVKPSDTGMNWAVPLSLHSALVTRHSASDVASNTAWYRASRKKEKPLPKFTPNPPFTPNFHALSSLSVTLRVPYRTTMAALA
jgi:hypothetical protein